MKAVVISISIDGLISINTVSDGTAIQVKEHRAQTTPLEN
jgi:dihydroorotate dehydrogenase